MGLGLSLILPEVDSELGRSDLAAHQVAAAAIDRFAAILFAPLTLRIHRRHGELLHHRVGGGALVALLDGIGIEAAAGARAAGGGGDDEKDGEVLVHFS